MSDEDVIRQIQEITGLTPTEVGAKDTPRRKKKKIARRGDERGEKRDRRQASLSLMLLLRPRKCL
jgi:hypothetical protein